MQRTYRILHRRWRVRKPIWYLFIFELIGLVPLLVLFGLAQPDLWRTKLWEIGYQNGFNSNPNMVLYAYANYRSIPTVPLVWSQVLTNFNVAISVLTLFVLLSKLVAFIMNVWFPIIATFVNFSMVALYTVSVYGQIGPDFADERHPSPVAWYIRGSCDPAKAYNAVKLCMMAKGSLAATVYMLAVQVTFLAIAIHSMLPNKLNEPEEDEDNDSIEMAKGDNAWEKGQVPPTPSQVPYTPRTLAFRTLERKPTYA